MSTTVYLNTTKTVRAIFFDNGAMALVSYATPVITVDADGWLTCHGTYSRTTIKHIGLFMRKYTVGNYYTAKKCYTDSVKWNIHTGEIRNA